MTTRAILRTPVLMAIAVILSLFGSLLLGVVTAPAAKADGSQAVIGMPFAGKWAYNATVSPPYTDANSSHPSVHARYGSNWSTDLYAAAGTAVTLSAYSSNGAVTFTQASTSDTCSSYGANVAGRGITLNVLVNGAVVGTVKYDHLDNISAGPYSNGMTLGTVTSEATNANCYSARHVHMQFTNSGGSYSCYVDKGNPGVTLSAGEAIGVLGSTNGAAQQACASVPPAQSGGYADGTYVRRPNGAVYLMAGNAPFPVYSWNAVGGQKPYSDISEADFNAMPQYPKDGTYVVDYGSPSVYVTAGGAGMAVNSWQSVGGQKPVVTLPANSVGTRLRTVPLDGTYVVDYGSPSVYVIAGGAPFPVGSWESVGGQKPVAMLPQSSVGTRFSQYPANGTAYVVYGSPSVYIAAGGAGLYVTGWDAIGGPRPTTVLPASGVQAVMRSYPQDGTYVRNYSNGAVYYVSNGATSHLYSWGPAGPQPYTDVDAWAITNQLHATE